MRTASIFIGENGAEGVPGAPRRLFLDIQGHRNDANGYNRDAFEILKDFLLGFMMPYLDELHAPLYNVKNSKGQRNDMPQELVIYSNHESDRYGGASLQSRSRESQPVARKTTVSPKALAEYLGTDEACLICWGTPAERAHALPKSLGGSNDVRNFAFLCERHHKGAPDVADAEAFWAWIDYTCERDGHEKLARLPSELLEEFGIAVPPSAGKRNADFWSAVRTELVGLYGWTEEETTRISSELLSEYYRVLEQATTSHFNVARKASTHAWAYDAARRRIRKKRSGGLSEDR